MVDVTHDAPRGLSFTDLVGLDGVRQRLAEVAGQRGLPVAMLLSGRAGIGKRALAGYVAALWLCERRTACGTCGSCLEIATGRHPEVFVLDATSPSSAKTEGASRSSGLRVADVDQLCAHLETSPETTTSGRAWRIGVIIDADAMTAQAASRLLKTLEEAPSRARIIVTSSRARGLLPTIRSRLVNWHVPPPGPAEGLAIVRAEAARRGIELPENVAERMLRESGFAPGQVLERPLDSLNDQDPREQLFHQLLAGLSIESGIGAAERMARGSGLGPQDILRESEFALNALYRKFVRAAPGRETSPELRRVLAPQVIAGRRASLRQVHDLAVRRRIAVNAQMVAEQISAHPSPRSC